jgi:hypothetical protein
MRTLQHDHDEHEGGVRGLAIRDAASLSGICPSCGVRPVVRRDREHDGVLHATFPHEHDCDALCDGDGRAAA